MAKVKYNSKELCLLWLDSFIGLEYKHKLELYNLIQGKTEIRNVLIEGKNYIESMLGTEKYSLLLSSATPVYLNYVLDGLERRGLVAVTLQSETYPETLRQTEIPPIVLYAKGNLSLLKEKCFAIVGSRRSLPLSIKLAENYAKEMLDAGFTLVTGIAEGVDKAVLDTALRVNGKVISVLACGFDNIYPKPHANLVDEITKKGLVITEYLPETVSRSYYFPVRNRIIAGLSKGSLIVSAGVRSGAIYTAEYTEEYGRDLFVVPYSVGVSSGVGCNELIKRGGMLTDTPNDILGYYGIEKSKVVTEEFSDVERGIINALSDGGLHVEKIAKALSLETFEVSSTLSIMEIKGLVTKTGVNIYGLSRNDLEE